MHETVKSDSLNLKEDVSGGARPRLIRSLESLNNPALQKQLSNSVVGVTIGNFDGYHIGHQELFSTLDTELATIAQTKNLASTKVLLTFWPHPRAILSGLSFSERTQNEDFHLATSVRDKLILSETFDIVFLVRFNSLFFKLSPGEFVSRYLVKGLGARVVVVGTDWGFGKNREGNVESLTDFGHTNGFSVSAVSPVELDGRRVSTTWVKEAIRQADFETLKLLLDRSYSISGRVHHGEKRGRKLGFPTLNLSRPRQILPPNGVYATKTLIDGKLYSSVTNIGVRPTFSGKGKLIETHIIGEELSEIYGQGVTVTFYKHLRPEQKFSNVDSLKTQIADDCINAKAALEGV